MFLPDSAVMDQLNHAIELCALFKTKMIRGFSFYHPKGTSAGTFTGQAVERLGPIAERCREAGVVFGMEIEANLIGENGETLADIHRQLANENVVTVWDGANVACRNIDAAGCLAQYRMLESSLGWSHVKDYRIQPGLPWTGHVDETRLKHFVPAGQGDAGYPEFLADLRTNFDSHAARVTKLGLPGVLLTLEPHLKGGGQFGGLSGPDGVGVALRALCKLLDQAQIDYDLCDMPDIIERRGF